jgi:phage repressor protein C with HTH and peptisase S24 domain
MSGVGTRIKKAREALGMTQTTLAKAVGVSQQAVMELESGRAKGTKHCAKFARALGQDPLWLETGDGRMREAAKAKRQAKSDAPDMLPDVANFERIPVIDIRTSSGRGAIGDGERTVGFWMFSTDWLRAVTPAPFSQLVVVQVSGDSMEPTLHNGDYALIDSSQLNPRREGIYVLRIDDTLMIKRVTVHPATKRVTLGTDNARYQTYEDLDAGNVEALGRVIWIGHTLG